MSERRIERVGGWKLAYEVSGVGEPLVLIHGLSGSRRWWQRNVPVLEREFTVFSLDLFGFGESRGQPVDLHTLGPVLKEWLDGVVGSRSQRAHLVAHSMGGLAAVEIAAQQPEWLDGLVLVDALAHPIDHSLPESALRLIGSWNKLPFDFYPQLAYDALRAGPRTLFSAIWQIHKNSPRVKLESVQARTLILWGDRDLILPLSFGRKIHSALPASRFIVLPGASHILMWDKPDVFNQAVIRFLRDGEAPD